MLPSKWKWSAHGTACRGVSELDRPGNELRGADTSVMPDIYGDNRLFLDDVHSFVLRVSVNRFPSGNGGVRPRFQLEHVNSLTTLRLNTLEDVLKQLESQVRDILDGFGTAQGC